MADMYSGGSTSAIASSAPEHGKGGSADAISMSAAEVTRRLTAWISPHGRFLVLAAASSIATVVLQLWVPIIVGSAIDQLIRLVQGAEAALLPTLAQLSLVVLLASATQWLASWSTNKLTYLVTRDLRDASHAKVANLPLSYIDTHSQGDLLSRVVNDVDQLGDGLQQGLTQFLTGVVTIIGTLCFMFYMSIPMGLVVALATPLSIIVASVITKYASSSFSKQQGYQGQLGGCAEEMVSNQKLITAFAHKDAIIEQFEAINEKLRVVGERAQFASSLSNPSTRLVNNFIYALVAGLGCICVLMGVPSVLTIGQVQSFLSYANQYMKPFNAISAVVTQVQTAYASARRVFDLLDAKEIKPDPVDAEAIQNPQGTIEFDDVAFSYRAEPGQKIALVGPTGCGKTTLINLLLRFYSIDSGAIYVDGHNTQKLTRASLREQFGMVLQDTWLFKGTIKENIRYAKPDATDEEIIAAAQKAQAHEFIQQLSQGYDTMVGESGGSLSQGQQQLLCIARVMLANPPILLLDEATSSIDTRTEQLVQKAFDTIMNGRTSLVVAHRLSTIQGADCILVLKDGSILERGTHDELLAKGGFYANLYESQFEGTDA